MIRNDYIWPGALISGSKYKFSIKHSVKDRIYTDLNFTWLQVKTTLFTASFAIFKKKTMIIIILAVFNKKYTIVLTCALIKGKKVQNPSLSPPDIKLKVITGSVCHTVKALCKA